MAETLTVERWLYTVLHGDATLLAAATGGVHSHVAPQGTSMPFLVYQFQGGADVRGVGPTRVMASTVWIVQAVGETAAGVKAIADRADVLLQAASGSNADGTIVACVREAPFSLYEQVELRLYRHLGGMYRIWVQ